MAIKRKSEPFDELVYDLTRGVPSGLVTTYGAVARAIGRPGAARAVGRVLNKNPDLARVPCHRVVRSDGKVGGYVGGIRRKIRLLRGEGVPVNQNRISDFKSYLWQP